MTLMGFIALGSCLFLIGLMGVLRHRAHFIQLLMGLELMLLGVTTNFLAFSHFLHRLEGHVMTLFILGVAAAESAIGLAIFVLYFRKHHVVDTSTSTHLQG